MARLAGHAVRPVADVAPGVAGHRGLARGAAGGVQTDDVFPRHGEQSERIIVAHVLLFGKRQKFQVAQGLDVLGSNAYLFKAAAVKRHVGVHARALVLQAAQLKNLKLLTRQRFQIGLKHHRIITPVGYQSKTLFACPIFPARSRRQTAVGADISKYKIQQSKLIVMNKLESRSDGATASRDSGFRGRPRLRGAAVAAP